MTSSTYTKQSTTGQPGIVLSSVSGEQVHHYIAYIAEARKMRAQMFSDVVRGAYARLFQAGKAQPAKSAHETHRRAPHAA